MPHELPDRPRDERAPGPDHERGRDVLVDARDRPGRAREGCMGVSIGHHPGPETTRALLERIAGGRVPGGCGRRWRGGTRTRRPSRSRTPSRRRVRARSRPASARWRARSTTGFARRPVVRSPASASERAVKRSMEQILAIGRSRAPDRAVSGVTWSLSQARRARSSRRGAGRSPCHARPRRR